MLASPRAYDFTKNKYHLSNARGRTGVTPWQKKVDLQPPPGATFCSMRATLISGGTWAARRRMPASTDDDHVAFTEAITLWSRWCTLKRWTWLHLMCDLLMRPWWWRRNRGWWKKQLHGLQELRRSGIGWNDWRWRWWRKIIFSLLFLRNLKVLIDDE